MTRAEIKVGTAQITNFSGVISEAPLFRHRLLGPYEDNKYYLCAHADSKQGHVIVYEMSEWEAGHYRKLWRKRLANVRGKQVLHVAKGSTDSISVRLRNGDDVSLNITHQQ